jgi:hypothetical protein
LAETKALTATDRLTEETRDVCFMGTYSKLHDKTFHAIKGVFPEMVIRENIRPDWLISRSGTKLEIDLYLEQINVAIEIQGIQHYEFTPRFHKTYQDFVSQKDRDEQKRNLCRGNNIRLVEIASNMDLSIFIKELSAKRDKEKQVEPKYFYQKPEKKVRQAGKSVMRFANIRKLVRKKELIRLGLLPPNPIHKFNPLPGSQKQREHAKRNLQSNKMQDGRWVVWGGRNTHILTYQNGILVCDCWHAENTRTICSHIIRTMIDDGTFPTRESTLIKIVPGVVPQHTA